jgi:hypothetical protein
MDDDEFFDRLNQASRLLTQQVGEPLPGRADADRAAQTLAELERDPATSGDLEREAALDAVYRQLGVLRALLRPDGEDP